MKKKKKKSSYYSRGSTEDCLPDLS